MFEVELLFDDNGKWAPMPDWCYFFIKLGAVVATAGSPEKRLVVGVSVPTRAYAACLTAAGTVIARAAIPVSALAGVEEHFNKLCRLEIGTPLVYRKGNRKFKAIFAGVTDFNNETRIKVQTGSKEGGNLTELLNKDMSLAVSVAAIEEVKLPKKQAGQKIIRRKSFLDNILGKVDTCEFALSSRLESVISGPVAGIRREVIETRLAVRVPGKGFEEGTFQDLLRVRRFLTEDKAFRTEVYPANGKELPVIKNTDSPTVAIFDGALGFLKWRNNWQKSNWIILLNRTEHNFREAAEILNQEFIKNRLGNCPQLNIPPIPPGIELIVYEEEHR